MPHISIYLRDYDLLHQIDELVKQGYFRTRSHAFEFALKQLLKQYKNEIRF